MSGQIERVLRVVAADEPLPTTSAYWRARPVTERLAEAFRLHHEGNALFLGGDPPFQFCIEVRDGRSRR